MSRAIPPLRYPSDLPVVARKDEILAAIRDNQVVIVAGETGSGKSTQLPKICLELGRGVDQMIGHTQPRRIAARAVAERVAEELGTSIGGAVGYTVRFTDRVGDDTLVKVMTDGILLAELQRDRMLRSYDTIIVDEAHERSLNIDFILGYLRQLLPQRPDLKVIVTSATIDTERFSGHFSGAPVVAVSGRAYPVEVRYRPLVEDEDDIGRDQTQAICDAVEELAGERDGDVLVFLSGQREIRDTAQVLTDMRLRDTEILPLYARLSAADQHRVFAPHRGRRIVLATNVAETSLTVPGIRYVVDAGTARVSRYNRRTKVQRLPIEPISQAAANQRAGRCGRVAPGICIRLYAEDDFASRPEFTDPEILRTNLASVILQMAAIGLGDIAAFPFLDPPDSRNISDGVALLEELGALDPLAQDPRKRLTRLGRRLARLPLDPRLGRMLLESEGNGCAREVMVIAAAISIQDPRERPEAKRQAADEMHARFADKNSDFLTYVKLWDYLREQQRERSSSSFRRLCKAEYFNYLRVREWADLYSQLRQVAASLGIHINSEPADPNSIHRSILAGLLSHVGVKDDVKPEYLGARNMRFAISPGSALFKQSPRWVMAAELVETPRLWARVAARIQPEWVESAGSHLVNRTYSEPHWNGARGRVEAYERVTLYGLPIVAGRKVDYGRVDPAFARELFIRHALVEGDWYAHHEFLRHNSELLDSVLALEDRARRRDIAVDDEELFDFYDERVSPDVVSGSHFDSWWKRRQDTDPGLLDFTFQMLVRPDAGGISAADFPDVWQEGPVALRLSYRFDPDAADDGVTVHVPLLLLNQVDADGFDWHIPGHREELVTALIRSLPKPVRRHFIPVPEHVAAFLARAAPEDGPLITALERELARLTGTTIPAGAWQLDQVPDHLKVRFRVEDEQGSEVGSGRDIDALKAKLLGLMRASIASAAGSLEQTGLTAWTFGDLRSVVEAQRGGHTVRAYPSLVDEGGSVAIRALETEAEQAIAMAAGTRRLLLLTMPSVSAALARSLSNATKLALARGQHTVSQLLDDCAAGAVDALVAEAGGPAWTKEAFALLRDRVRSNVVDMAAQVLADAAKASSARQAIGVRLDAITNPALGAAVADIRAQLDRLVGSGFVLTAGAERLPDVLRYLQAIEHRLDRLAKDPVRDQARMREAQQLEAEYAGLLADLPTERREGDDARQIRWMLEELRVSMFAQKLKTPYPVSERRISRAMDDVAAGVAL